MRSDRFASALALRTSPSTQAATSKTTGSPPTGNASVEGQLARWIEPSCHQDHTSSVAYGRNGANRRSRTSSANRSDAIADPAASGPLPPYARPFTSSR